MAALNPVGNFQYVVYLFDAFSGLDTGNGAVDAAGAAAAGANLVFQLGKAQLFGGFKSVKGLNAGIDLESAYQEGGRTFGPLLFPKIGTFEPLTFERGVTFAPDLWDWQYQVLNGRLPPTRKDGVILLANSGIGGGALSTPTVLNLPIFDFVPAAIWIFMRGLPSKMALSDLSAEGNEIAIETITISHEGLFRLGTAQIPFGGDVITKLGV